MAEQMKIEEKGKMDLEQAEARAWDALARSRFEMFGYWAAIWCHLNRTGDFKQPNPFKKLVQSARLNGVRG
jgi:hypothetical protein